VESVSAFILFCGNRRHFVKKTYNTLKVISSLFALLKGYFPISTVGFSYTTSIAILVGMIHSMKLSQYASYFVSIEYDIYQIAFYDNETVWLCFCLMIWTVLFCVSACASPDSKDLFWFIAKNACDLDWKSCEGNDGCIQGSGLPRRYDPVRPVVQKVYIEYVGIIAGGMDSDGYRRK
jgi:hypothetical protein